MTRPLQHRYGGTAEELAVERITQLSSGVSPNRRRKNLLMTEMANVLRSVHLREANAHAERQTPCACHGSAAQLRQQCLQVHGRCGSVRPIHRNARQPRSFERLRGIDEADQAIP